MKHRTIRTAAKYRSWVLVKCIWCGAYYWFRLRKGTGYGFHAFLTCILLLLLLIQCKNHCIWGQCGRCGRCGVLCHPFPTCLYKTQLKCLTIYRSAEPWSLRVRADKTNLDFSKLLRIIHGSAEKWHDITHCWLCLCQKWHSICHVCRVYTVASACTV